METEMIVIGQHDGAWHDRFFRHVSEVFEGIDFSRWTTLGGWSEDYEVFAIIEDNEILATIGVSRMYFSSADIAGQPAPGQNDGRPATRCRCHPQRPPRYGICASAHGYGACAG
jgi:hypothetical protein